MSSRKSGSAERGRADHDALGAGVQGALDGKGVAKAAADLDARVRLGGDAAHVLEVLRRARARAVEVDDVKPLGPLVRPALRRVERVGVVRGLALVVALHEPHGLAAADIDCRVEDQAGTGEQIAAKFSSSRRPAELDFSGWNWTPKTLPRSTTAAKVSP